MADALDLSSTAQEPGFSLRSLTRAVISSLQKIRSRPLSDAELCASTIVFAPHQDDETLGCGGILARKSAAGAQISVVFLTDGSGSHPQHMAGEKLAAIRAGEALAATATLGISEQNVSFLGAPDGALSDHARTIIPALREILEDRQPEQIFVPYARDRLADHVATRDLVLAAIRQTTLSVTVFEYPVWFWNHWPWMQQSTDTIAWQIWRFLRESLAILTDFNTRIAIRDVQPIKIAALNCHQTQMTHFNGSDEWLTLNDVAQGDFLRCLVKDTEIFHRWSLN